MGACPAGTPRDAAIRSRPASFFPAAEADRATPLAGLREPWRIRTAISLGHPAPEAAPAGRPAIPSGRLPLEELVIEIP